MQKNYEKATMIMVSLIKLIHDIEYSDLKVSHACNLLDSTRIQRQIRKLGDLEIAIKNDAQAMEIIEKVEKMGYRFGNNYAKDFQSYFSELRRILEQSRRNGKENEPCVNILHPERVTYIG